MSFEVEDVCSLRAGSRNEINIGGFMDFIKSKSFAKAALTILSMTFLGGVVAVSGDANASGVFEYRSVFHGPFSCVRNSVDREVELAVESDGDVMLNAYWRTGWNGDSSISCQAELPSRVLKEFYFDSLTREIKFTDPVTSQVTVCARVSEGRMSVGVPQSGWLEGAGNQSCRIEFRVTEERVGGRFIEDRLENFVKVSVTVL